MARRRSFVFYALLLGTLTMMMPLGTDIFLPSMPAFAREYGVSMGAAELTLSAFFAGNATGQLIWGPVSDRFGRKPVVIAAVSAYFIAAAAVALSDSFAPVIFWRFVQGASGASSRILGNAIARDLYERERLAKLIAFVMTFGAMSAIVTGPLGGAIADRFEWQAAFFVTAAFAAFLLVLIVTLYDETIVERNPLAIDPVSMVTTMVEIVRSRVFLSYVLISGCGMAGLSAWINSSPGVLIGLYGIAPGTFGLAFGSLPLGFMAGSIVVGRYAERLRSDRFLQIGSACTALAGLAMLALAIFGVPHPLVLVVPMLPYLFGFAFLIPQSASGALTPFGRMAGTASSLQGFIQSMIAAAVSAALGLTNNGTLYPMAIAIACAGLATLGVYAFLVRPLRQGAVNLGQTKTNRRGRLDE